MISEYTDISRIRRAISWVYCAPKSRIAILSRPNLPLARRPQLLGPLEDLPFRLDGRGDDQLRLLQLADVHGAHPAHALANRAAEVERAVLCEARSEENLLERSRHAHANPCAARQVRVRRGHAPVIAAAGRLGGARE